MSARPGNEGNVKGIKMRRRGREDSRAIPPVCPFTRLPSQWCQPTHHKVEHGEVFKPGEES